MAHCESLHVLFKTLFIFMQSLITTLFVMVEHFQKEVLFLTEEKTETQ